MRGAVVTTSWDDGYVADAVVAELLSKYGLPGTFYVPVRAPYRRIESGELRRVAAAFEIGAHTVSHVPLTRLPDAEAEQEIVEGKEALENEAGCRCEVVCYPEGRFRDAHLKMAAAAGFVGARTVQMLSTARPDRRCGLSVIPTTIQVFPHRLAVYARNVCKRGVVGDLMRLPRLAPRASWADRAKFLFDECVEHGGIFHLWGHSWEIEAMQLWTGLEDVLAHIAGCGRDFKPLTNSGLCYYANPVASRGGARLLS